LTRSILLLSGGPPPSSPTPLIGCIWLCFD